MLRYLRHVRQALIEKGNVKNSPAGRYTLYAIGEILLVVVGILIALQINTLNDNRKDQKLAQNYLEGIKEDAQSDVKRLNNFLRIAENYIQKVDSISSLGGLTKERLDKIGITRATYFIKNDTYQEIIANGHLKLLPIAVKRNLRDANNLFKAVNKIDSQMATTLNTQHLKMAGFFELKRQRNTSKYQVIPNSNVDQNQALLTYKNYINLCYDWQKTKVLFYSQLKKRHLEAIELIEESKDR